MYVYVYNVPIHVYVYIRERRYEIQYRGVVVSTFSIVNFVGRMPFYYISFTYFTFTSNFNMMKKNIYIFNTDQNGI